jgi:hypothetical protein
MTAKEFAEKYADREVKYGTVAYSAFIGTLGSVMGYDATNVCVYIELSKAYLAYLGCMAPRITPHFNWTSKGTPREFSGSKYHPDVLVVVDLADWREWIPVEERNTQPVAITTPVPAPPIESFVNKELCHQECNDGHCHRIYMGV